MSEHCIVYVDGFNFYYAIKRHPATTPIYLGWCDFVLLASQFLLPENGRLMGIKYFTAPVGAYGQRGGTLGSEAARQQLWLDALRSSTDVEVIEGYHTGEGSSPKSRREPSSVSTGCSFGRAVGSSAARCSARSVVKPSVARGRGKATMPRQMA
ncbi:MAG: hypothetical protein ACR2NS_12905 [Gemmatimonadaceae bacterium]